MQYFKLRLNVHNVQYFHANDLDRLSSNSKNLIRLTQKQERIKLISLWLEPCERDVLGNLQMKLGSAPYVLVRTVGKTTSVKRLIEHIRGLSLKLISTMTICSTKSSNTVPLSIRGQTLQVGVGNYVSLSTFLHSSSVCLVKRIPKVRFNTVTF